MKIELNNENGKKYVEYYNYYRKLGYKKDSSSALVLNKLREELENEKT